MPTNFYHDLISNPANTIAAISSLGTFITAFIALRAIKETQKQRESSYKPEIYISRTYAEIFSPDFGVDLCRVNYMQELNSKPKDQIKYEPAEQGYIYDTARYLPPALWISTGFNNIGMGTAKMIDYNWQFDYNKAVEVLNDYEHNCTLKFDQGHSLGKNTKAYYIKENDLKWFWSIDEYHNTNTFHIDFLEHKNQFTMQSVLNISDDYLDVLILYLFYKHGLLYGDNATENIYELFEDLPPLKLIISYSDIQNKRYKKQFQFSFSFSNIFKQEITTAGLATQKKKNFGTLYIDVREIIR